MMSLMLRGGSRGTGGAEGAERRAPGAGRGGDLGEAPEARTGAEEGTGRGATILDTPWVAWTRENTWFQLGTTMLDTPLGGLNT